jgi:nicotinamide phosphoribosyltransferase
LQARSNRKFDHSVFFGLQYHLKKYLCKPITKEDVDDFLQTRNKILGPASKEIEKKMYKLSDLGYWPIKIKSVREGTVIPVKNVLMTMTNTHPDFYWVVGFLESLILQLWYPCTVATTSFTYRKIINKYYKKTVDDNLLQTQAFMVHDFGFRGQATAEGLSGMAHLLSFKGSDTIAAYKEAINYYNHNEKEILFTSIPASEHSVMCSFGKENEIDAFRHILDTYPNDMVSIVSDTYDIYNVVTNFARELKDKIMQRKNKTIFRPDSGNPEHVICGDPAADPNSPEGKGCIVLLDEVFGNTINSKGFKVLNNVGLIYGDGMYLERYERVLERLVDMGYSVENLAIGVGGILRYHSRDTLGFAIKSTKVLIDGVEKSIMKDPITDKGKRSHMGLLRLDCDESADTLEERFITRDNVTKEEEAGGCLETVFEDGKLLIDDSIQDIRNRVEYYLKEF